MKAEAITIEREILVPKKEVVTVGFKMELSPEEAGRLLFLLGKMYGDSRTQEITSTIYGAMVTAGVEIVKETVKFTSRNAVDLDNPYGSYGLWKPNTTGEVR